MTDSEEGSESPTPSEPGPSAPEPEHSFAGDLRDGDSLATQPTARDAAAVNLEEVIEKLERENAELQARLEAAESNWQRERTTLQARLDFVEELVGPTEAQRKAFQLQLASARTAALNARRCGAAIPTRFVGRLDESWLHSRGLSERECALLQRGCIAGLDNVPQDVSVLGDPSFLPYDEVSLKPRWEARGGHLHLSLGDIRKRWGEEVAMEVVRCAIELDRYDASRRLGVELPWHALEGRELQPCEVISLLERELASSGGLEAEDTMENEDLPSPATSPVTSIIESVYSLVGHLPNASATSSAPLADGPPQEFYEWSLADADIEQLLLREAPSAKGGGPRSLSSSGPLASPVNSLDGQDVEDENMALLELVNEEFATSFGIANSHDSDFGTSSES